MDQPDYNEEWEGNYWASRHAQFVWGYGHARDHVVPGPGVLPPPIAAVRKMRTRSFDQPYEPELWTPEEQKGRGRHN
jgi:hypothetical protein